MTGLTAHQLWALKILSKDTPLRVSDLARAMHLRPPTVVGILDRLEAKGLVLRSTAPNDRRVVLLQPTHQALRLVADAPDVAQNILLQGLSELNDDELYCVQQGMRLMTRLLQAEHLVPQPLHS